MEVKTINFQEEEPMTNLFQEFVLANPTLSGQKAVEKKQLKQMRRTTQNGLL